MALVVQLMALSRQLAKKSSMRKLTLRARLDNRDIDHLEKLTGLTFPDGFKKVLLRCADSAVLENTFYDPNNKGWHIASFWNYEGIYGLTKEFREMGFGSKIAFAHDRGGWSYCLSLDPEDYNAVYVYRFTDQVPEEAFLKIADSFEEFIDRLEPERQQQ